MSASSPVSACLSTIVGCTRPTVQVGYYIYNRYFFSVALLKGVHALQSPIISFRVCLSGSKWVCVCLCAVHQWSWISQGHWLTDWSWVARPHYSVLLSREWMHVQQQQLLAPLPPPRLLYQQSKLGHKHPTSRVVVFCLCIFIADSLPPPTLAYYL